MEKQVSEGSLHKWFKGSKSKDGKGGWVNVVTGGTCASDEPGEGTPKCVSSAKRASMTKAERLSAARRKKKADPNQQQKSGAAKPTYVSTDKPKKKKMKETYERSLTPLTEKAKKCWPGYEKKGTKKMFGKTYNNCVKKEEVELEAYSANPAQQAAIAIAKKKKKEEDMVAMKKKKKNMYAGYEPEGELVDENIGKTIDKLGIKAVEYGAKKNIPGTGLLAKGLDFQRKLRSGTKGDGFIGDPSLNIKNPLASKPIIKDYPSEKQYKDSIKKGTSNQYSSYDPEGETIEEADKKGKGSGTKDACYHKVKSRYSVWPSAYASGALVKCRKVGAANWGNSSKKEAFSDWKSEFIWEDGDSSKKIEETVGKIQTDKFKIKPGVKGDGFLGPTVGGLGVPNPIRITQDVVDTLNRGNQNKVDAVNKELPGSASMGKFKEFNKSISPATKKLLPFIKSSYDYEKSDWRSDIDEDWQKTNRQDKTDGMSQKAVNAYRRENPGSKLKTAVTQKPSTLKRGSKKAKRRKSFCSRMKGMKKRLTSAKTARDPDSRINKALRRWNC
jgi:hypothetical protein